MINNISLIVPFYTTRKVSLAVLDDTTIDYDHAVKKWKADVESLYSSDLGPRRLKTLAMEREIKGISLFGDNVGKVK